MRSWLSTESSQDSFELTLSQQQLSNLISPLTAAAETAVLEVRNDELTVHAIDTKRVRAVTTTLPAASCHQYTGTPCQLAFDPTVMDAAMSGATASSPGSAEVTLSYPGDEGALSIVSQSITQTQPVEPDPEQALPTQTAWPESATVHHQSNTLAAVCEYFTTVTEMVSIAYDVSESAFRIESVPRSAEESTTETATAVYERSATDLPGETTAVSASATFYTSVLHEAVATIPENIRVSIDIVPDHPLRLRWVPSATAQTEVDVEAATLIAPCDVTAEEEAEATFGWIRRSLLS
ncbi:hypothetical protein [Halorubrum coriense]|uniref:hypothetical protein n=1 Tax=Halorubrum coriense TaxID=64713 RepID=UPI001267E9BC|nr:hypothetical protein [Halorubrum coriense]